MSLRTNTGIELFQVGRHHGTPWTVADLLAMVSNAELLKDRHVAPIAIGHDETQPTPPGDKDAKKSEFGETGDPSFGLVPSLRVEYRKVPGEPEPVATLVGDFAEVPEYLSYLIDNGAYRRISAEVYTTPAPGLEAATGPILKRVSLLGSQLPAVKTLADVTDIYRRQAPAMAFSERSPRRLKYSKSATGAGGTVLVFSEVQPMRLKKVWDRFSANFRTTIHKFDDAAPTMTRDEMISALGDAGFDVSLITDTVPDAAVSEFLRVLKMQMEATPPADAAMSDATTTVNPPADTAKHSEELARLRSDVASARAEAARAQAAADKAKADSAHAFKFSEQQRQTAIQERITARVDGAIKARKVAPAERDGLIDGLAKMDAVTVHKFGDASKTLLDSQLDLLDSRPEIVRFGERLKTPKPGGGADADEAKVLRFAEEKEDEFAKLGQKPADVVKAFNLARARDKHLTAEQYLPAGAV